jgi:putative FmdB family regulatory protein
MPTYEYQCRSCAHRFDARQSITAAPRTRCPHCGKKVDRLISAGAGFLFKGAGFYSTDYRSRPYQEAAKKDKAQEGSGGAPATSGAPPKGSTGQGLKASDKQQSSAANTTKP